MAQLKTPNGFVVLVDKEDLAKIREYKIQDTFYIYLKKRVNKKYVLRPLHYVILDLDRLEKGSVVDHINGNKFDCRKRNLRVCTKSENNKNRKCKFGRKYKGVFFRRFPSGRVRFQVVINSNGKRWCKLFAREYEAVKAYNQKARELHGEFACLNVWTGPSVKVTKFDITPQPVRGHRPDCPCCLCRAALNYKIQQKGDKNAKTKTK